MNTELSPMEKLEARLKQRDAEIEKLRKELVTGVCRWESSWPNWSDYGFWKTSCGHTSDGRRNLDPDYKFCPYCGKPLEVVE